MRIFTPTRLPARSGYETWGMAKIIPSMSGRQNDRIDASALGRAHALTPVALHHLEEMPHVGAVSGRELAMRRGNWDALAPTIGKLPNLGLVGKVQACVQGGGADAAGPADGASRPCRRAGLTTRKPWPPPARQRGYGLLQ
uniref:Hypothethical protein (Modular protein) n=1 Tax=Ralstonia solanacearum TaxID=305 RepID=A0A0S4UUN7_RALSL|nr:Hypothethical protein (modular protein) [Ralstonia solanacearum]CUV35577.1 Hypothethical protein (modular protein) [Ralstonia solanacearum]CUV40910.1 Hypothethical protein (modular protein) [Ralstonia solanacearum]CUV62764.1 Hypothethical protein (modular protein) [Ralstonia solanacearum]